MVVSNGKSSYYVNIMKKVEMSTYHLEHCQIKSSGWFIWFRFPRFLSYLNCSIETFPKQFNYPKWTWPATVDFKKHSKDEALSCSLMLSVLSQRDAISFETCSTPASFSWNSPSAPRNLSSMPRKTCAFATASSSFETSARFTASTAGMQEQICFWSIVNMGLVAFADGSAEINDSTFSEITLHSDLAFCSVIACLDTSMAVAQRVLPKVIGHWFIGTWAFWST